MSNEVTKRRRVFFQFTIEENKYFSKIYHLLDYENKGKINSDSAAHFLRDSDLKDSILKEIFLLTSHKDIHFLEKDELYIILRLISLAQNKISFDSNSLERNTPIPPLPKFYFLQKANLLQKENLYQITENVEKYYSKIFNEQKDTRKEYISKLRATLIWNDWNKKNKNFDNNINEKIIQSLEPLKLENFLHVKEFIVGCYLLCLSRIIKMPIKLPQILLNYLGRNQGQKNVKDVKYPNVINIIPPNIDEDSLFKIGYQPNAQNLDQKKRINDNSHNKLINQIKNKTNDQNNNINKKEHIENYKIGNNNYNQIHSVHGNNRNELYDSEFEINHTLELIEKVKEKEALFNSLSNNYATSVTCTNSVNDPNNFDLECQDAESKHNTNYNNMKKNERNNSTSNQFNKVNTNPNYANFF